MPAPSTLPPLGGSALPADDRPPATRPSQGQKQPPHGGWPPPSGGWPPPRQGARRGPGPGPGGRPPSPQLQQRALAGLLFGLLSMFGLFAFSDLIGQLGDLHRTELLVGFSLVVGAVSLWLGVTAVTGSRRAATARPRGAASAIVLGGIGVVFSVLLLALFGLLSKEFSEYSRCMKGANTLTAQQECHDELTRALHAETRSLRNRP